MEKPHLQKRNMYMHIKKKSIPFNLPAKRLLIDINAKIVTKATRVQKTNG